MDFLPNSILGVAGMISAIIGAFVIGIVAIVGLLDKGTRERKKKVASDLDHSEDRLVDILKKTVNELEAKVNQQTVDIAALTKKIDNLEKENETVIKVLQGRDEQSQQFFKEGFVSMKIIQAIRDEQLRQSDIQNKANDVQTKLLELLSKHISTIDHAIIKPGSSPV